MVRRSDHYCWLKHCTDVGTELISGDYRIVLCVGHRAELEVTSEHGYSLAAPPERGGRPVKESEDLKVTTWWPWKLREESE